MNLIVFLICFTVIGSIVSAIIIAVATSNAEKKVDNELKASGFTISKTAASLRIDEKNKKWCINNMRRNPHIYDFSDIVDSKIEENSVLNKVNSLGVYIYTKNNGAQYIPLINSETKRDSFTYSTSISAANTINSLVQSMISRSDEKSLDLPESSTTNYDNIEEQLKKLKGMADSGLITQEDFEAKKKQLLGL